MQIVNISLMAGFMLAVVASTISFCDQGSAKSPETVVSGEEVKQVCIPSKTEKGKEQCFTVRRTLLVPVIAEKGAVKVSCVSSKTGEKKSVMKYEGPGAHVISDKEFCVKLFGTDFDEEKKEKSL